MADQRPLCVSSFGPAGFDLYGRKFIETFVDNVEADLVLYIEGMENRPSLDHPSIEFRDLFEVDGLSETLKLTDFEAARGLMMGQAPRNYRYDIHTFCRKSFAQIDAAIRHYKNGGKALYWIDADVEFFSQFSLPDVGDTFLLYLGRPDWHSCASFLGWNLQHKMRETFFDQYRSLYVTGTVFALPEWHDSYVIDWLRSQLKLPTRNLAEGMRLKGPANVFDHVFPAAHHKKGELKRQ